MGRSQKEYKKYRLNWVFETNQNSLVRSELVMENKMELFTLAVKILEGDAKFTAMVRGFLLIEEPEKGELL